MYLMNDLVQKAKMINKRREAHQQMTPEYKLRFDFQRCFVRLLGEQREQGCDLEGRLMQRLFEVMGAEEYLDSLME